ncbi:MAG: hypothetical protein K6T87_06725 [Roseiflexus sp.]|uniref:hypothetical protein n=1 Tax=Roseiflexus sp. TaxID=2562120 RepID=UPI0025D83BF3|nr:hypothetical protein [Roseiflexus sp.]MCL6540268.1 hypothetical protein [Roseiflexus sp.]
MIEQHPVATARARQATQTNDYHREPPVQTILRWTIGCFMLACGILLARRLLEPGFVQ